VGVDWNGGIKLPVTLLVFQDSTPNSFSLGELLLYQARKFLPVNHR
jgi:hypothetical protein